MAPSVVRETVRTLVVIWSSTDFDVEAYAKGVSDREDVRYLSPISFGEGNKTLQRLLRARYSGGHVSAILFLGDKLLGEKPEGPGVIASYISPRTPDPDITVVFPQFAPAY